VARGEIRNSLRRLEGLTSQTLQQKWDEYCTMNCVFQHLCLLEDLGLDILRDRSRGKVVVHINRLVELTYLGFMYSMLFGDYFSSARSLRWIYEGGLAAFGASRDGEVLTGDHNDSGYLSIAKFERWMRDLDLRKPRAKFGPTNRERILMLLGLSQEERDRYKGLYSDLCRYSHLSKISLRRDTLVPNLTIDLREFSRVYRMNVRTMDLYMFAILKSYEAIDGIEIFLNGYRSWFSPGNSHTRLLASGFPLTKSYVYGQR